MPPVAASSWIPPSLPDSGGTPGWALLDTWCYIADRRNATTANGFTSQKLPIEVTFHAARPPVLSHFCVHCPDMDFPGPAPKVVATHADLVLIRVPSPDAVIYSTKRSWDYFVYRAHPPLLHLLPNPHPKSFNDSEVAIISHGGGYVIATLRNRLPREDPNGGGRFVRNEFDLNLYSSANAEEGWISKRLSVDEHVRDKVVPMPYPVPEHSMYHVSGKTITIGGERGTVAWVDLWRGIILCDMFDDCLVLRDIPLPPPAMGNWGRLLQECEPNFIRDVTVSQSGDSIKYVEMEIRPPIELGTSRDSYLEWVHKKPSKFSVARCDGWKATTWSIPIPVVSWEDWHTECEVDVTKPWLSKLHRGGTEVNLQELPLFHPTMSMDDDVVYFLSKMDAVEMVVAVDVRKMLYGVSDLDSQKNFTWMPTYCCSEITSYLKKATTVTLEALETTGKEEVKPKPSELHHAKDMTIGKKATTVTLEALETTGKEVKLKPSKLHHAKEMTMEKKATTVTLEAPETTGKEVKPKPSELHHAKEMTKEKKRGKKPVWRRVPLCDAVQFQVVGRQ